MSDTLLPGVICMYHGIIATLWTVSRCSIILSQLLCTSICSLSDENCFDGFVLLRALQMCSTEDVFYSKDNV